MEIDLNTAVSIVNEESNCWASIKETAKRLGPLSPESLERSVELARLVYKMSKFVQGDTVLLGLIGKLAKGLKTENYEEATLYKEKIKNHVHVPNAEETAHCKKALGELKNILERHKQF